MGRRRCCCGGVGCLISRDEFNRENSTNIGDVLTEIGGEWEIVGQELSETGGTPGAIVVSADKNHYGSKRGVVDLEVIPTGSGPWDFYILVNADSDASNYQYARFAFSTTGLTITTGGTSRTYDTTSGGGKPAHWVWPTVVGNLMYVRVCITEGLLYGKLEIFDPLDTEDPLFTGVVWDNTTVLAVSGDGYAGIRWDAGDMTWDDWQYWAAYRDDTDCPVCVCRCAPGNYPPWKIRVDWYNAIGDCPCFDGGYGIFEWSGESSGIGSGGSDWICVEGAVCGQDISYALPPASPYAAAIDCGVTSAAAGATQTDWDLRIVPCTDDVQSTSIDCEAASFEIKWDFTFDTETCSEHCTGEDTFYALGTDGT